MKKLLISILAVGVLAFAITGVASAQGSQPPVGTGPMAATGQTGPLHTYMVAALAETLDLSVDQVEARLAAGETAYQIALAQGIPAEDIPALMAQTRTRAVNAAVTSGVMTQAQAERMLKHGFGRGGMGQGMGPGQGPCDGTGIPVGSGVGWGGRRQNP